MPVAEPGAMSISRHHPRRVYHRILSSVLVLAATVFVAGSSQAEDNFLTGSPALTVNNLPRFYLTLATGVAPDIGVTGMAELTAGGEHLQVSGRVSGARSISVLGPPSTTATELGLMAGYGQSLGLIHFYAAAGMGIIRVNRLGRQLPSSVEGWSSIEYERLEQTVFNIPVQVGLDFGGRVVAGGLALVANLNSAASYVGILVTVNLGRLRARA